MVARIDLTGQRFGMLTAIRIGIPHQSPSRAQVTWVCLCDCGNEVTVQRGSLRNSTTQSCGCLRDMIDSAKTSAFIEKKPEYNCWAAMKQRCMNPKDRFFHDYGGRGIRVCERWSESFDAFFADMGNRPSLMHSIDRIDTNGNYEPGNCRWATSREQSRNKRNNVFLEIDGRRQVLADWANEIGINWSSLYERIQKYPLQVALTAKKGMNHGS